MENSQSRTLAFETDARGHNGVHASEDSPADPGAARIGEESFEDVVGLLQQLGCFSAPPAGQLQIGELREEPRKEQTFTHTARRDNSFAQRTFGLAQSVGFTKNPCAF